MSYVKATTKYIFKNAKFLLPMCILPSVILAIFVKPLSSLAFLPVYASSRISSMQNIIDLIVDTTQVKYVYPLILIFASLLLSVALCVAMIERHFRTGRLSVKKPFTDINETFFPVLKILLICAGIMALYTVILISLVTLAHFTITGKGTPNIADIIVSSVIVLVTFVLFIALTGPIAFILPVMITYGYSFSDAVTSSFTLVGKKPFKIITGGLFPFAVVLAATYILSFFTGMINKYIVIAINAVLYLYLISYLITFIMTVFFDVSDLDRKDIKKYGI